MSGGSSPKHETAPVALCERRGGPATYRRLDNLSHFLDCRPHDRLSSFIDQRQEYTGILPLEGSAGRIIGFWPVLHRKSASCRRRHSTTRVETGHLFLLPFRLRPSVEVDGCSGQRIVAYRNFCGALDWFSLSVGGVGVSRGGVEFVPVDAGPVCGRDAVVRFGRRCLFALPQGVGDE